VKIVIYNNYEALLFINVSVQHLFLVGLDCILLHALIFMTPNYPYFLSRNDVKYTCFTCCANTTDHNYDIFYLL